MSVNGIHLDFQSFQAMFDFAPDVEASVAEAYEPYVVAYMAYLNVKPFGDTVVHQKAVEHGKIKTEKVQAFTEKQYLYVCRTIDGKTRVFKFFAPTGLLLVEAVGIAEEHYKLSTLELS